MSEMSRAEVENLQRLIRQREKVLKSGAKQRSAELLADFKNQMGQEFSFDDDEVWRAAAQEAQKHVEKAQALIAAQCRKLGIPNQFAPSINLYWSGRGYGNKIEERKRELLGMAITQIQAQEARALTEIERSSLEAQTRLALAGNSSEAAQAFIDSLPSIEQIMPRLTFEEVAGDSDPPIAEKLISSNALRQRRFRERQAALKASAGALPAADSSDGVAAE